MSKPSTQLSNYPIKKSYTNTFEYREDIFESAKEFFSYELEHYLKSSSAEFAYQNTKNYILKPCFRNSFDSYDQSKNCLNFQMFRRVVGNDFLYPNYRTNMNLFEFNTTMGKFNRRKSQDQKISLQKLTNSKKPMKKDGGLNKIEKLICFFGNENKNTRTNEASDDKENQEPNQIHDSAKLAEKLKNELCGNQIKNTTKEIKITDYGENINKPRREPHQDDWICENCKNYNFHFRKICNRCHVYKNCM